MIGPIQSAMHQALGSANALATGVKAVKTIDEAQAREDQRFERAKELLGIKQEYAMARLKAQTTLETLQAEKAKSKASAVRALKGKRQADVEAIKAQTKLAKAQTAGRQAEASAAVNELEAKTKLTEAKTARTQKLIERTEQLDARRKKDGE